MRLARGIGRELVVLPWTWRFGPAAAAKNERAIRPSRGHVMAAARDRAGRVVHRSTLRALALRTSSEMTGACCAEPAARRRSRAAGWRAIASRQSADSLPAIARWPGYRLNAYVAWPRPSLTNAAIGSRPRAARWRHRNLRAIPGVRWSQNRSGLTEVRRWACGKAASPRTDSTPWREGARWTVLRRHARRCRERWPSKTSTYSNATAPGAPPEPFSTARAELPAPAMPLAIKGGTNCWPTTPHAPVDPPAQSLCRPRSASAGELRAVARGGSEDEELMRRCRQRQRIAGHPEPG